MKRLFLAAGAALLALFCTAGCSVSAGGRASSFAASAPAAPAVLSVSAPGGYRLSVQAVFYFVRRQGAEVQERNVPDVLTLSANGKTAAIRCAPLYGFLQNGGWEPVFRLKYGG